MFPRNFDRLCEWYARAFPAILDFHPTPLLQWEANRTEVTAVSAKHCLTRFQNWLRNRQFYQTHDIKYLSNEAKIKYIQCKCKTRSYEIVNQLSIFPVKSISSGTVFHFFTFNLLIKNLQSGLYFIRAWVEEIDKRVKRWHPFPLRDANVKGTEIGGVLRLHRWKSLKR